MKAYKRFPFVGLVSLASLFYLAARWQGTGQEESDVDLDDTLIHLHPDVYMNALRAIKSADWNGDFEGFDNETGAGRPIVPNIVHFVRFNQSSFTFSEYACFRSVYVYHRPDYIFIHTNVVAEFRGRYWRRIKEETDLFRRIVILYTGLPSKIYGHSLPKIWRLHHGSDFTRLRILIKYGGICVDNDVFTLHSLDKYRQYEMTLGWERNSSLGCMVLIANRNARFLRLWRDNYVDYRRDNWTYNFSDYPTNHILERRPGLVHRVEVDFGIGFYMGQLYQWWKWVDKINELDTVHLLVNHRKYLDVNHKFYRYFNEKNIQHYPFAFGQMVRNLLNVSYASQ